MGLSSIQSCKIKDNINLQRLDWSEIKAVIFDVDGTLYDQGKMRRYMFIELLKYYSFHLRHLQDLKILMDFRKERENQAFNLVGNLDNTQYVWGAKASNVSEERIRSLVNKWIYKVPLKYIYRCRFPGVSKFFNNLSKIHIVTAIFSDYPAKDKMAALKFHSDYIFCATDQNIDRLKPDPKGLFVISEKIGIPIDKCLFIGNRDDRDGECARKALMPYLIIEPKESGLNYRFQTYNQLNLLLNLPRSL